MNIENFVKQWFGSIEVAQAVIKESQSLLPEGALTNEGLYWISPKGKVLLVNNVNNDYQMGHEEYANTKWNCSLEDALQKGYVRIQAISPQYLYVDHQQNLVRNNQVPALTGFFFSQQMATIPYGQMAIQRAGDDMRNFKEGENAAALQFAVSGEVSQEAEPEVPSQNTGGVEPAASNRDMALSRMHPAYKRPGVNPFGDSTDYSFAKWIAERTEKKE